jgi:hypothetical protein
MSKQKEEVKEAEIKEEQISLDKISTEKLKAIAFDISQEIKFKQTQYNQIYNELARRSQEENKK